MLRPRHFPVLRLAVMVSLLVVGIPLICRAKPESSSSGGRGKNAQSQAGALYQESQELRKAGNSRGALAKVEEAYQILPTPTLLWPIAELQLQLGHPTASLETLRRYRQEMVPSEMEPGQQIGDVDRLEDRIRGQLSYLRITAASGARVSIDGKEVGQAPLSERVAVDPGKHRVTFGGARGAADAEITVEPGAEAAVSAEGSGDTRTGFRPHALTWSAIAITGAVVLAASVFGGLALTDAQALDNSCTDKLCLGGSGVDIGALNAQVSAHRTAVIASTTLWATSALFAAGTGALLWYDWKQQKAGRKLLAKTATSTATPRLAIIGIPLLAVSGDSAAFVLGGRF